MSNTAILLLLLGLLMLSVVCCLSGFLLGSYSSTFSQTSLAQNLPIHKPSSDLDYTTQIS